MHRTGQFYRPPTEADTLLLEVNYGCMWNKCSFCNMYSKTQYGISPLDDVEEDLKELKLHNSDGVTRIFLLNGDSFILSTQHLLEISKLIQKYFPQIKTISAYATVNSIKNKSLDELKILKNHHYNELYIGIESGNDTVLKILNKGFTKEEIESLEKLEKAEITYNALIMMGCGGKKYSKEHVEDTIELLNRFKPKILSLLSTVIHKDTPLYEEVKKNKFGPLAEKEMIDEELTILKSIKMDDESYFFGNHEFNTIPATGYFKHKDFIIEYMEDEKDRLMNEKEYVMESTFNTYPKKRGGFILL